MNLEELAQEGNELAMKLCKETLDKHGSGAPYRCVVGSVASALLFHLYRLGVEKGISAGLLRAVLDDVSTNLVDKGGFRVKFSVTDA